MCQRTDGRTDRDALLRSTKLFRAVSFFFSSSCVIWPNDLSVNWCSLTWISISDALNHNFEKNCCLGLFIYTLRDIQIVLYILLFDKTQPSYHTVRFNILPTKATFRIMSSTRWIQSPSSDPTMLESHLPLCRPIVFYISSTNTVCFTQCFTADLVVFCTVWYSV